MLLSELGNIINYKHIINLSKNKEFNRVSSSSKEVNKKTIFFINNKKKIKTEYLLEALNKKTPAIISNKIFSNLLIPQFIVEDVDKEINKILKTVIQKDSKNLKE